ncbi:host attachment family protein [Maritimibacter sp. HL-12]|jgi:protein required for attachment to host cells|uniref:host attachment family protein n=1 Tax=Maritimibacter sp. HL-12 TaxID=1162418 RepID=UPI000A0F183D|nr:host attachment family protein [Maritimibacter sp. HL-12]SMH54852.1 Protein required for attachment to host cells [Maritimibacter sp. HL-12]
MKPIKTLVLLADDGSARLFENLGVGKGLTELEDFAASMVVGEEVEYADRPGRMNAAPGMGLHAFDTAEAEHDQAQEAFVKAVLAETDARFTEGGYDRFVMVAAPSTLGALRAELPAALKEALVLDVAKDYLKLKPAEVVNRLADQIVL